MKGKTVLKNDMVAARLDDRDRANLNLIMEHEERDASDIIRRLIAKEAAKYRLLIRRVEPEIEDTP